MQLVDVAWAGAPGHPATVCVEPQLCGAQGMMGKAGCGEG